MTLCRQIVTTLSFLQFMANFRAIQKLDSGCMVCKISNSSHTIPLRKGTIFAKKKKLIFFAKNADISKIKGVLVFKGIFSETTYVCVLTYQISSF